MLAANDADADEESMPSEFQSNAGGKRGNVVRRAGGFGQMSGADSRHYTETAASKKKKREAQARLYLYSSRTKSLTFLKILAVKKS